MGDPERVFQIGTDGARDNVGAFADQPRVRAIEQHCVNFAIRSPQECGYPCRRELHAVSARFRARLGGAPLQKEG